MVLYKSYKFSDLLFVERNYLVDVCKMHVYAECGWTGFGMCFSFDIGQIRVSDTLRYATSFQLKNQANLQK